MAYFANSLQRVATILDIKSDVKLYQKHYKQMLHTLDGIFFYLFSSDSVPSNRYFVAVHWDTESQMYTDVSFAEDGKPLRF
jgi:hypothetical protein